MTFSLLSAFPADVWSEILYYLDTFDQMIVWNTGSQRIQEKLGPQGGWRTLKFESLPFLKKWPRSLLSRLSGLCALHLSAYEHFCILPQLRPTPDDLIQLPQTLVKLKLDFVDALRDEHLRLLPNSLYHLSLPYNRSISPVGLFLLPPGITNLNLKRNLRICDASGLPPSLVSFKGNASALGPSSMLGEHLPPSLTLLKLEKSEFASKWKMSDISFLASHPCLSFLWIRHISHHTSSEEALQFSPMLETLILEPDAFLPNKSLENLPIGLKRLKIVASDQKTWDWTDESVLKLPRGLKHLELLPARFFRKFPLNLTPHCFRYLPRELETLKLGDFLHHPNGFISLRTLPHSLTDLRMPGANEPYISAVPPNLVRFGGSAFDLGRNLLAPVNYSFARPTYHRDPYYSHFSFTTDPYPQPDLETLMNNRDTLPKKLETLFLGCDFDHRRYPHFFVKLAEEDYFEPFPRFCIPEWMTSLRTLSVVTPLGSRSDAFQQLPRFLTKLTMSLSTYLPLEDAHFLDLPDTLTDLDLQVFNLRGANKSFGFTDECIWALPHDLVALQISGVVGIRFDRYPLPKRIQTLALAEEGNPHPGIAYRPLLPFWTTHLSLLSTKVSIHTFESGLPTYLTKLVLNENTSVESHHLLPVLPSTLTHLEASGLDISDRDVGSLPTSLRVFICLNASRTLSDTSASHWPPLILKLTIKGSSFTNHAVELLPKSITSLTLVDGRLITNPDSLRASLGAHILVFKICGNSY